MYSVPYYLWFSESAGGLRTNSPNKWGSYYIGFCDFPCRFAFELACKEDCTECLPERFDNIRQRCKEKKIKWVNRCPVALEGREEQAREGKDGVIPLFLKKINILHT